MDDRLLWYTVSWLLCIITLPFSTTLVTAYFGSIRQNRNDDNFKKKIFKRAKPTIMTENQLSMLKDNNAGNLNEENKINKPYLVGVLLLTLILPLLCGFTEWITGSSVFFSLELIGKWFIFWSVGLRLFIAGLRQVFNPSFTAKTIFHVQNKDSYVIVKELGFANICFGLIGIISFFLPQWRIVSAFGSGLFYGIAGVNHLIKKQASPNEKIAMVSDIFIFIVLMSSSVCSRIEYSPYSLLH